MALRVKRLRDDAVPPERKSKRAAGYDIASVENTTVPPNSRKLIQTGLAMAIPDGYYGRIAARSKLAKDHLIDVSAGVIDADYRGPVGVLLVNESDEEFKVKHGDRIAQLILEKITTPEIEVVDELDETERGSGGFGSTGLNDKEVESKTD